MMAVTRAEVMALLSRWEVGELDEQAVHEQAEEMWSMLEVDRALPEDDYQSIIIEAIAQLEILNRQLVTPQDVPAFRRFLAAPEGREREAWSEWRSYWEGIDMRQRRRALADRPYYVV